MGKPKLFTSFVNEHIKQIKDKRLPQVIKEATNIFNKLTNAAYVQITYADDKIMVKHHNGQVFEPMELSQSTKEILYISLRLSLIKVLKPYYHLPIIVDDAFVHFDKKKTYNAELFKRFSRKSSSSLLHLYQRSNCAI